MQLSSFFLPDTFVGTALRHGFYGEALIFQEERSFVLCKHSALGSFCPSKVQTTRCVEGSNSNFEKEDTKRKFNNALDVAGWKCLDALVAGESGGGRRSECEFFLIESEECLFQGQ